MDAGIYFYRKGAFSPIEYVLFAQNLWLAWFVRSKDLERSQEHWLPTEWQEA